MAIRQSNPGHSDNPIAVAGDAEAAGGGIRVEDDAAAVRGSGPVWVAHGLTRVVRSAGHAALGALRVARAVAGLLALMPLVALWRCVPPRAGLHRPLARRAMATVGWAFRLRVRVHGEAIRGAGLIVANHISWTDIIALGMATDAAFVAKAEIAGWPLVGALTRHHGGLFVNRARRGDVAVLGAAMAARWAGAGDHPAQPCVLFAEGTTSVGGMVLPFHAGLFAPAAAAGAPVQPVAIRYARADGAPLTGADLRRVAWVGDKVLAPHAWRIATGLPLLIEITFAPPLAPADRKTLARASRAVICGLLGVDSRAHVDPFRPRS